MEQFKLQQMQQMALAQQQAQMNNILNNKQNINENKFNQNYIYYF